MLELGQVLHGEYRIDGIVGQGGFGSVYVAEALRTGRRWAIKELIPPEEGGDDGPRMVTQFKQEAALLARLQHSGLPRVASHFEEQGSHYLVMEFIEGETLQDLIDREGQMEEARALRFIRKLTDILHYLHSCRPPIIFRDLKPSNVMVTPQDDIKLIDFGIAKEANPDRRTQTAIRGVVSPGFSAVEQFGMEATDERTDIYSLGATAYFMLTRTVPPLSLHRAFNQAALLSVAQLNQSVSAKTASAVEKMLAVSSNRRFQSIPEVQAALGFQQSSTLRLARPDESTGDLPVPIERPGVLRLDQDDSELVWVPGGVFWMGSPDDDLHADEKPMHKVLVRDFYIGRLPVTFAQFARFVAATGYQTESEWTTYYSPERGAYPVLGVSLYDAMAYASWARVRLPTEAEWEKAARGPRSFLFPWGDQWEPNACNHAILSSTAVLQVVGSQGPVAVGTMPAGASPFGAQDMVGNVLEWTSSLYRTYPYVADDGRNSPPPRGEWIGRDVRYVLRGGAWNLTDPEAFRCTTRYRSYPGVWSPNRGFRLAMSV